MKTLTKEEILEKTIPYQQNKNLYVYEVWTEIHKAMQSFSEQENARLTAINKKQKELIIYLKALTISHCPNEEDENRIISEIYALQDQSEQPKEERRLGQELIIDNNDSGEWTIDKISVKEVKEVYNCIHFDCCQGRNHCLTDKVKSVTCIGVDCGHFEDNKQ